MIKLKYIASSIVMGVAVAAASMFYIAYGEVKPEDGGICKGVYIDSVSIGEMTQREAVEAVSSYIDGMSARQLEVNVSGNIVEVSLDELGFSCEKNDYITQALNIGKTGNIVKRYNDLKNAQNENARYELKFRVNEKKVKRFVEKRLVQYTEKAINATIKRKNRRFVYTDAKNGQKVDVNETVQKIKTTVSENKDTQIIQMDAVVVKDLPKYKKTDVSRCKDEIGTYTTNYNAGLANRSGNVANAASLIDGSVIYPGEVFSVYDAIAPLEESNGYFLAPSYSNGEVVDSLGGGVCQVSTTLYNAVLRAELEIVERSPHSMVVSYVSPSMDAAIAGTYKDFKFKNNTDTPIYLMGGAHGGSLYFKVFGNETRSSGRKVEFESEILDTVQPGSDKVTYDPQKPNSYQKVTQESHIGYRAKLWKKVTENGKTEKTQINTSSYAASPRYIVRGSLKENKKKDDKKKDGKKDENKEDKKKDKKKESENKVEETSKPKVTESP